MPLNHSYTLMPAERDAGHHVISLIINRLESEL